MILMVIKTKIKMINSASLGFLIFLTAAKVLNYTWAAGSEGFTDHVR